MSEYVTQWLQTMLYSGAICGLFLYICPGGKVRELLETGAVCVLLLGFLSPLYQWRSNLDEMLSEYDATLGNYELQLENCGESLQKSLIEKELEAYIFSEAKANGVPLWTVQVETQTDENGVPVPVAVWYQTDGTIPEEFRQQIATQLGVATERQCTYEAESDRLAGG